MIKALAIDWGAVLMRTVNFRPRLAWEERLGLTQSELADLFFNGEIWDQAQRGQATEEDVWNQVAQQLNLDPDVVAALRQAFWSGDRLDQDLVALIRHLRTQGLRTALISNFSTDLPPLLSELGVADLFDVTVISALEGVTKPDLAIYQRALDRLGLGPAETVFVDDMQSNVNAAQQLGMAGIRFRGLHHLQRALVATGLPVEPPLLTPLPNIRAVIFDWGGVLSPLTYFTKTKKWEERLGLARGTLNQVMWGMAWKQLEIGVISQAEYQDLIARGLGLPDREAVHQFFQEYFGDDYVDARVVAVVRALRDRYQVAMLSNAFIGHAEMAQERFGFDPRTEFDQYINSAEVALAKPDPAIFELALDRLGVEPQEALFIDDMVRNADAAQALGINSLVFTAAETGLSDLEALLGHPILPS